MRKDVEVCQGIPDVCIGVPFYDPCKEEEGSKDDLSMKDAKFEVEIELENNEMANGTQSFSKIKVFQGDSESESGDSYRIDLKK